MAVPDQDGTNWGGGQGRLMDTMDKEGGWIGDGVGRWVGWPPENFFHSFVYNGTAQEGLLCVRDDAVFFDTVLSAKGPGSTDIAKEEAAALGFWVGSRLFLQ